jgi:hypothetical protein
VRRWAYAMQIIRVETFCGVLDAVLKGRGVFARMAGNAPEWTGNVSPGFTITLVSSYPIENKTPRVSSVRWPLTNDTPFVHGVEAAIFLLLLEAIPEAKCFIASTSYNDLTVWAHGKVEHSIGVSGERNDLLHAGVLPDNDLVLGVAVCRDNFVAILRPCKIADLASGVQASDEIGRRCERRLDVARSRSRRSR